jgi:hypothetical protein
MRADRFRRHDSKLALTHERNRGCEHGDSEAYNIWDEKLSHPRAMDRRKHRHENHDVACPCMAPTTAAEYTAGCNADTR